MRQSQSGPIVLERGVPKPVAPTDDIKSHIRTVPDWPAPGVQFRDITPLLSNPRVFRVLIDQFVHRYFDLKPSAVAGLDARSFIIGSVLACELGVGFVPIRKRASCRSRPSKKPMNSNTTRPPWRCTPAP